MHTEDAWLHSINAAPEISGLDTSVLLEAIGEDGVWALQTSLRLSKCKLWTFAPAK